MLKNLWPVAVIVMDKGGKNLFHGKPSCFSGSALASRRAVLGEANDPETLSIYFPVMHAKSWELKILEW